MNNTNQKPLVNKFLGKLPASHAMLAQTIVTRATYEHFPTHAAFIHDEGLEQNGMNGFYTSKERIDFYRSNKALFKAFAAEQSQIMECLSIMDWYAKLDYPMYESTGKRFEFSESIGEKVFVAGDDTYDKYGVMADALVCDALLETAKCFVRCTGESVK